ncbi:hypothetical protein AWF70_24265 [Escherichia coli]|nr:hypothetical protein AWF70_24265 [Escherichia coli]
MSYRACKRSLTTRWCFRERLLDEAKRMTQDALKDTSRMENENRSG